jgi:hypothetical protein
VVSILEKCVKRCGVEEVERCIPEGEEGQEGRKLVKKVKDRIKKSKKGKKKRGEDDMDVEEGKNVNLGFSIFEITSHFC